MLLEKTAVLDSKLLHWSPITYYSCPLVTIDLDILSKLKILLRNIFKGLCHVHFGTNVIHVSFGLVPRSQKKDQHTGRIYVVRAEMILGFFTILVFFVDIEYLFEVLVLVLTYTLCLCTFSWLYLAINFSLLSFSDHSCEIFCETMFLQRNFPSQI